MHLPCPGRDEGGVSGAVFGGRVPAGREAACLWRAGIARRGMAGVYQCVRAWVRYLSSRRLWLESSAWPRVLAALDTALE